MGGRVQVQRLLPQGIQKHSIQGTKADIEPPSLQSHLPSPLISQTSIECTTHGRLLVSLQKENLQEISLSVLSFLHTNFYINKLHGSWAVSLANPLLILFSFEIKFCFQVQDKLIFSSCTQLPAALWPFSSAASFLWEFPLLEVLRASQHACILNQVFYLNFYKFKTKKKKKKQNRHLFGLIVWWGTGLLLWVCFSPQVRCWDENKQKWFPATFIWESFLSLWISAYLPYFFCVFLLLAHMQISERTAVVRCMKID